jgi:glycosyltransferase involved in cell wall biosynthesis
MHKLTAIIPCKNEEHNIEDVLQSVSWADEIMVVDSFSTDRTVEIARKYTDFILEREYDYPAKQKNWAIPQASHQWILLLDADERATPELKEEIQNILKKEAIEQDCFWIHRKNYFMGKEVKHGGWQRDKVIRLFKRDVCRYDDKHVHEEIVATEKIGKLKHRLIHNTFKDTNHYLEKIHRYAKWSAEDAASKVKSPNLYHFLIKPAYRFFKQYIIDRGFLDGKVGFVVCGLGAYGVFLRYVKLLERCRK